MKAVPISMPNSRAIWIVAAMAAACGGVMFDDREGDERGDGDGEADRLDDLRGQEIVARPVVGQAGIHPAADRDQREADGEEKPRVDPAQREHDQRDEHELRQRDPVQHVADLQRAQALDAGQIVRQDKGRRRATRSRRCAISSAGIGDIAPGAAPRRWISGYSARSPR